ncbi:MAG: transcriptional regulator [Nitrospinaceae bacterium]|nr:transcriptional regulator [Nitrospinaceae bacterium]NIR56111.1 transcriptional regulator [Nitrospinaceae bacterium]NIS86559.1 transcriptional regulator [Nitrospinaceae bacterium]NIT83393.1 transcriptional regulator [Nitrospinaceae bacterium]NIU45603.1 transcriptional regulator [Nitrospinaceae bacterium]
MNADNGQHVGAGGTPGRLIDRARNPFWMAPMSGITDVCFRQLMDELGAGVLVSELVSARGLVHNSERTRRMIAIHPHPGTLVGVQLFGEDAEDFIRVAPLIGECGADFLDINLGCPVQKVVKKGCGSALMRDPAHLEKFLTRIQRNIDLPLTVKMRTGWNEEEMTLHECIAAAHSAGCEWVAIHGRTRAQGYQGRADWDLIREARLTAALPVIGNGDIRSAGKARELLQETGVDAVMIGRAALRNPWIFRQCTAGSEEGVEICRMAVLRRYHQLLAPRYDTRRTLLYLRKMAVWMAYGYPGASVFRGQMFQIPTTTEVLERAEEYFSRLDGQPQPPFEESEAFMMGGHG